MKRNADSNDNDHHDKKKKKESKEKKKESSCAKARRLYESAKKTWLYPNQDPNYEFVVKKLLRKCIRLLENEDDFKEDDEDAMYSLRMQANDALTLLCIQKSNYKSKEVYRLLRDGGYVARLSQDVLRYLTPDAETNCIDTEFHSSDTIGCPCRVYDDALPEQELYILRNALCPEKASFWKDHSYSVYPPTPYFSYAFDLKKETLQQLGALGSHVSTVLKLSSYLDPNGDIPRYAEIWAHHRPHCSGHQLHFDSDNEGRGEVKHPLFSSILYLSESGCGGPSLMTDQRLGDVELAQNGWLAFPKKNRLCVFDGSVLHGVIPGRGYVGERKRVSLMVALWKDIRIREGDIPGAARPLPMKDTAAIPPEWFQNLTIQPDQNVKNSIPSEISSLERQLKHTPKPVLPLRLGCVFSTRSGKHMKRGQMPEYERVFQGF